MVIKAGHSGAKAVWCETMTPPNCADEVIYRVRM